MGFAAGSVALAACAQPAPKAQVEPTAAPAAPTAASQPSPTAVPPAKQAKLIAYLGGWTPTESMERSEDNPAPHNKILEVIDGYKADHPGVEIEWIRLPGGTDSRQWQIAQQTAGTVPHLLPAEQWLIKEDLEKDWWVKLSDYLKQANPYVKAGDPGSKAWLDQFYPTPTSMLLLNGEYYNVCFSMNTTWFFYNVDLFAKHGLKAPTNFKEFLANCQVAKDAGLIGYDFNTMVVSDTDSWYRQQLGQMILARDVEPKINPKREAVSFDAVACALWRGDYTASLPQFRQWLELWKQTVPYRRADWNVEPKDPNRLFLTKKAIVLEQGSWAIPQLEVDPMMDFEWATFWAPPLTVDTSTYVTDPPTQAQNVGTVTDNFAISTRAHKDNVLDLTVDFLRWVAAPDNAQKVLTEISANMPNVKNVVVADRFKDAFKWVVESIGYVEMFAYEICTMDQTCAEACGKAWRGYLLDQMTIDQCIDENNKAFKAYTERYMQANPNLKC
jgi:ABC-type glycerol-3-phosphate transport system substrate-binding protein